MLQQDAVHPVVGGERLDLGDERRGVDRRPAGRAGAAPSPRRPHGSPSSARRSATPGRRRRAPSRCRGPDARPPAAGRRARRRPPACAPPGRDRRSGQQACRLLLRGAPRRAMLRLHSPVVPYPRQSSAVHASRRATDAGRPGADSACGERQHPADPAPDAAAGPDGPSRAPSSLLPDVVRSRRRRSRGAAGASSSAVVLMLATLPLHLLGLALVALEVLSPSIDGTAPLFFGGVGLAQLLLLTGGRHRRSADRRRHGPVASPHGVRLPERPPRRARRRRGVGAAAALVLRRRRVRRLRRRSGRGRGRGRGRRRRRRNGRRLRLGLRRTCGRASACRMAVPP